MSVNSVFMIVGIITFHCSYNYGAILQSYALQQFLKGLGYQVVIINYRPAYLETTKPKLPIKHLLKHPLTIKSTINKYHSRLEKYRKFKQFESEYYNLTSLCRSKEDIEVITAELDYVVLGSDQIWCSKFNGGDMVWYGDFSVPERTKLISYAASAGDANFTIDTMNKIRTSLNHFSGVSVREVKLQQALTKIVPSLTTQVVLDPTLLVSPSFWKPWYNKSLREKKYVLVRQARQDTLIYSLAFQIADQLDAEVITADVHEDSFRYAEKVVPSSPDEFVSLIKNAECVISNSFHGIALALSMEVPFYATRLYDGGDERVFNLLSKLSLLDRFVDKNTKVEFERINYSMITPILKMERLKSQDYLKKALK